MSDTTALALATAGVWAPPALQPPPAWRLACAGCRLPRLGHPHPLGLRTRRPPLRPLRLWLLIRSTPAERRCLLLHALGAAAITITILSPILLPALETLRQPNPQSAIRNPQFSELSRWNPLYAFRREFTNADGRLTYELPNGLYYATLPARPLYFTPVPLAFATLPGLWRIIRRPTPPLLLLLGWLAAIIGSPRGLDLAKRPLHPRLRPTRRDPDRPRPRHPLGAPQPPSHHRHQRPARPRPRLDARQQLPAARQLHRPQRS
ncbi:MAG: hypothetical protein U0232_13590 [Thermomicrobiales bacterium]